ncbi:redoxin family protein [Fusibacter bizertensis]|uniref:Redoxin family protein n=1 Tax=Fusibacter bizertensis TaxID=1488331 RepID=A0ABT6NBP6_9FIRM|nr:redoxin family protein [Fusibacter bizertensis]MDH8677842.1 redoxin family protein [Fusibacter bizertensis]
MKKNSLIFIGLAILIIGTGIALGIRSSKENMESNEMAETTLAMNDEDSMMAEETMMTDESIAQGNMGSEEMMSNDGALAPDFVLMNLEGEEVSLSSLKGEKVYVKFWASWCSICLAGLEELDDLSSSDQDFKVITIVSPDYNGEQSKDDFITWFSSLDYKNIEVLLDENGSIAKAFGVRAYPTSAYIGSDSILIKSMPGHVDNQTIAEAFMSIY